MRWLVHGLLYLLVIVTAARGSATASGARLVALLFLLAVLVSVYSIGARLFAERQRRRGAPDDAPAWGALWYLAPTIVVWMLVLVHSPDAVWIAFGLDLAVAAALPLVCSIPALVLITCAATVGYVHWDPTGFSAAALIGPSLGALVALVGMLAVRALQREITARTLLARRLLDAQEQLAVHERDAATAAERERIARELHDTVAQSALGIQIMLDAARTALEADDSKRAGILVGEARRAAALTSSQARALVDDSTAELDPCELPSLLADLMERVQLRSPAGRGSSQTQAECRCETDRQQLARVHSRTARTVLRLAESLLGNAVTHADASRIVLSFAIDADDALLDVVDDGIGIPPGEREGFGLRSARARAHALGGELTIESGVGEGTAVQVRLPLPAGSTPAGTASDGTASTGSTASSPAEEAR